MEFPDGTILRVEGGSDFVLEEMELDDDIPTIKIMLVHGQIWFNKKSTLLSKSNEAIYPFYILHQTVIIVLGYYIVQLDLFISLKIACLPSKADLFQHSQNRIAKTV